MNSIVGNPFHLVVATPTALLTYMVLAPEGSNCKRGDSVIRLSSTPNSQIAIRES